MKPREVTAGDQQRICEAIESAAYDFTAKFYATYELHALAQKGAIKVTPRAIHALQGLLLSDTFAHQRQSLFLYREAAGALTALIQRIPHQPISWSARGSLQTVLRRAHGKAHLAAAESLGRLPLDVRGPQLPPIVSRQLPSVGWEALLPAGKRLSPSSFRPIGRCWVASLPEEQQLLVIKLARGEEDVAGLHREVQWMTYLANRSFGQPRRFDIPRPLMVARGPVFRLNLQPVADSIGGSNDPYVAAIGFVATKDYFCYPNDFNSQVLLTPRQLVEVLGRNAFLLGYLAGRGIVHEAPIPLFHNRVQQDRRRDGGIYEWYRGGRLDCWLGSCAYPNFGVSGLRDFEHFVAFNGNSLSLYRHMGNQLLSLLLVAGSYFRAKAPFRRGWDANRRPVDVRDQFDASLLQRLIDTIFCQYHLGFVGQQQKPGLPINTYQLTLRMIEEMGVDRHMEEYLRVADQQQMPQADFEIFLSQRGYQNKAIAQLKKGSQDLAIQSGPHLGAFNRCISLPELIEAVAAMAATCVLDRFMAPCAN